MKILMFEPGGWGGICHYSFNLCQALSDLGVQVVLLSSHPYELSELSRTFEIDARLTKEQGYWRQVQAVGQAIIHHRPNIFHIQSTVSIRKDWALLPLLRAKNLPVVYTAHNIFPHDIEEQRAFGMHVAHRLFYGLTSHVIVHSRDSFRTLRSFFRLSRSRMTVIPHGNYVFADTGGISTPADARRKLGLPTHRRYILSFGTLRPYKGISDLIDAFAQIQDHIPDTDLLIAGKPIGQDPETYRRQIRDLGIENRVAFRPGYVPIADISLYFHSADIVVFPYHAIYQSGALQLAYAFSKPVIATRVGAFPETVESHRNGLLISPHAPRDLAQAIHRLMCMPQNQLTQMGSRSRELAETRYAWKTAAQRTLDIYHPLLAKH